MHKNLIRALVLIFLAGISLPALSQSWPARPVRVILAIAPGSVADVIVRGLSQEMSGRLGQSFVVENRPGGNMIIGAEACKSSAPDGYTICVIAIDAFSVNPFTFAKLPYDPEKDFKPVTLLVYVMEALVVNGSLAVNSVAELRALAAAKPGQLNFATLGIGSSTEFYLAWLQQKLNAAMLPVPYKGGGPVATALLAGEVQVAHLGLGNFASHIRSGRIKALAVEGPRRYRLFPDVPTSAEAGLGEWPSRAWWGVFAPAGTPDSIVARLSAEIRRLFSEPKFAEFLESNFMDAAADTPEAFAAFLKADRERGAALVKQARQAAR